MNAEDGIDLLGSNLNLQANGVIRSEEVAGRLAVDDRLIAFDSEPMTLAGQGTLDLTKRTVSPSTGTGTLLLTVDEAASFDVEGGTRIQAPDSDEGPLGLGLGVDATILTSLALVLLLAGAIVERRTGTAGRLIATWRSRRFETWMSRGHEHTADRRFDQAAACFEKAARLKPKQGIAWYYRALSHLEADDPVAALAVIDEARASEAPLDTLDFLEIEAEAALGHGDVDRLRTSLAKLADGSEEMAASFARDLGLTEDLLGANLAGRLSLDRDRDPPGGLPGYA